MKFPDYNSPINYIPGLIEKNIRSESNAAVTALGQKLAAVSYLEVAKKVQPVPKFKAEEYCQGINIPAKIDDFNLSGLGQITLQPAIDELNRLKAEAIGKIKDLIASQGQSPSKDFKLAKRIKERIQQVRAAVQCYRTTVKKIMLLIQNTVGVILKAITEILATIDRLTREIDAIFKFFENLPGDVAAETITALNDLKNSWLSNITEIIALSNSLVNELHDADKETKLLAKYPKSLVLQWQMTSIAFQSSLNNLEKALKLHKNLQDSVDNMNAIEINQDYLSDFYANDSILEGSYELSLTNSPALPKYSLVDTHGYLYKISGQASESGVILIDSRSTPGYLISGTNSEESIISCGLDTRCGPEARIIFTLEINDGKTIIQAQANGVGNDIVSIGKGKYLVYEGEKDIDYNEIELVGPNLYRLTITNLDVRFINVNTVYTQNTSRFRVTSTLYPTNKIIVEVLEGALDAVPRTIQYIDPITQAEDSVTLNEGTLSLEEKVYTGNIVHGGDKLYCNNWRLTIQLLGNDAETNSPVTFVGPNARLFFINATWGFDPD